jgi:dihydroorotate dehydrogenase (fumarate)
LAIGFFKTIFLKSLNQKVEEMANLTTKYLGLELKNPLIVGSSGLTATAESIDKLVNGGVGAVVLKSVFEEEIQMEFRDTFKEQLGEMENNLEFFDYYDYKLKDDMLSRTTELISDVKAKSDIPVIASINCRSVGEWFAYASRLQTAGADALELNLFRMPVSPAEDAVAITDRYLKIVDKVRQHVSIPVSVKMSPFFTDLANVATRLDKAGVNGLVLFNRFYNPDFDLDTMRLTSGQVYSNPGDYVWPLRWVSVLSDMVTADIAASTGVHRPETFIKMLLAGASAVQVVTAIYKNGPGYIIDFVRTLEDWMDAKGLATVADINALGRQLIPANPEMFERVQFMKYFSDYK